METMKNIMKNMKFSEKLYAFFFARRFFEREISYELHSFIEYSRKAKIASLEYYSPCSFVLTIRYKGIYHVCMADRGEIHFDGKFVRPSKYLTEENVDRFDTVNQVEEVLDELLFSQ